MVNKTTNFAHTAHHARKAFQMSRIVKFFKILSFKNIFKIIKDIEKFLSARYRIVC